MDLLALFLSKLAWVLEDAKVMPADGSETGEEGLICFLPDLFVLDYLGF